MRDVLARAWLNLMNRPTGPFAFRFYVQPAMAIWFAIRDGIRDAKAGKAPYLWSVFTDRASRREQLRDGWKSIAKIVIAALILDFVYQLIVFKRFYPGEMLIVAALLAVIPYTFFRGPVNRIARGRFRSRATEPARIPEPKSSSRRQHRRLRSRPGRQI